MSQGSKTNKQAQNKAPETPTVRDLQEKIEKLQAFMEKQQEMIAASNKESAQSAPLSYAPTPAANNKAIGKEAHLHTNKLELPKELISEIRGKGYNYKFISLNKFKSDGGVHRAHWQPYRPEVKTVQDNMFGRSPEGYVVRGDCVLAVRPLALDKMIKADIKAKNDRLRGFNSAKATELKQLAQEAGVKTKVSESFED